MEIYDAGFLHKSGVSQKLSSGRVLFTTVAQQLNQGTKPKSWGN
jgi:hypothetical protein